MGGVDKGDMLIALYRTAYRTKKWYMAVFSQLLDLCVNNGWLLKRRHERLLGVNGKCALKEYRMLVASSLLLTGRTMASPAPLIMKLIRLPTNPRPPDSVRLDNVGHYPECTTKGRCMQCTEGQTRLKCNKCDLRFCLLPARNCFLHFHTKK